MDDPAGETLVNEGAVSPDRSSTDSQVRLEIMMDAHIVDTLRSVLAGRDGDLEDLARDLLRQAYLQMEGGDGASSEEAPVATPSPRSTRGHTKEPEARPSDSANSMSPATAMRQLHRAVRAAQEAADPRRHASQQGDGERFDPPPEVGGALIESGDRQNATVEDATRQGAGDSDQTTLPAFVLDILSRLGEDGALDDAGPDLHGAESGDAGSRTSDAVTSDDTDRDASMFDVVHADPSLESWGEGEASPSHKDACTNSASGNASSAPAPTIQLPRASLLRQTYRA